MYPMTKFSIVNTGANIEDFKHLIFELKQSGLISGMEKDEHGDSSYYTNSLLTVKNLLKNMMDS
jgi:hypothetical protein